MAGRQNHLPISLPSTSAATFADTNDSITRMPPPAPAPIHASSPPPSNPCASAAQSGHGSSVTTGLGAGLDTISIASILTASPDILTTALDTTLHLGPPEGYGRASWHTRYRRSDLPFSAFDDPDCRFEGPSLDEVHANTLIARTRCPLLDRREAWLRYEMAGHEIQRLINVERELKEYQRRKEMDERETAERLWKEQSGEMLHRLWEELTNERLRGESKICLQENVERAEERHRQEKEELKQNEEERQLNDKGAVRVRTLREQSVHNIEAMHRNLEAKKHKARGKLERTSVNSGLKIGADRSNIEHQFHDVKNVVVDGSLRKHLQLMTRNRKDAKEA